VRAEPAEFAGRPGANQPAKLRTEAHCGRDRRAAETLNTRINQTSEAGQGEVEALVNTGLSVTDARGLPVPVLAEAVRHQTSNLNLMGLFWDGSITLVSNRLANVAGANATWNAQRWNVAS
jgi:hypothetical protein